LGRVSLGPRLPAGTVTRHVILGRLAEDEEEELLPTNADAPAASSITVCPSLLK
jgi:hypothetical protein